MLLRILLAPLVLLWGTFLVCAGMLFPIPILGIISFFGLLLDLVACIFTLTGTKVERIEPFLYEDGNWSLGHFLGLTLFIWGPFAFTYYYIKTGSIYTLE